MATYYVLIFFFLFKMFLLNIKESNIITPSPILAERQGIRSKCFLIT